MRHIQRQSVVNGWWTGLLVTGLAALGVLVGCGSAETEPSASTPAEGCHAPNRLVADGGCVPPGVQDDGCAAGTLARGDGSCQPAGVPPELCADGFEPLADGCEPILPADPCPAGLMAIPGETSCREVAPCGTGTWGDIPVDDSTEYVDRSYGGADSDGTALRPWTSIGQAVAAAAPGGLVAIAEGSYVEDVLIDGKPVRLWGVCPAKVEVVGTGAEFCAVVISGGASGSEIHSLAVRGPSVGIGVPHAQDVLLDRLWVHDTGWLGATFESVFGPSSGRITGSLLEHCVGMGVFASQAAVTIEDSVLRDTQPDTPTRGLGNGIILYDDSGEVAVGQLELRRSVLEANHQYGVFAASAVVSIEGVVVRGTKRFGADEESGTGIHIQIHSDSDERSNATVRGTLIEDGAGSGLEVVGSDLLVEALTVRDMGVGAEQGTWGAGLTMSNDRGLGEHTSAVVQRSVLERCRSMSVLVYGSVASIEGVLVRSTQPRGGDNDFGYGLSAQFDVSTGMPSNAVVRGSVFEKSHMVGLIASGAEVTVVGTVVRDTIPRVADGLFGDGLLIASEPDYSGGAPWLAAASMDSCVVADNTRVGTVVFGAPARLRATVYDCNLIQLDLEDYAGLTGAFEDLGGNDCRCGEQSATCQAVTQGLEPPGPVGAGR